MALLERDVVYRRGNDGREWLARVYAPSSEGGHAGTKGSPILLDVHGGAWTSGNRFAAQRADRELAEALGMVVVAIDFRLAPADPYPAMLKDLNYAVRWIKAHADELGGSADRLGAIGWSSGGHMAVLAALKPQDPRYAALPIQGATDGDARLAYVVACWPPLDPLERYRFARATNRWDLVRNTEGCFGDQAGMHQASAERVVREGEAADMPPLLIVQGTADANIPLPMIQRFAETYREVGGDVQLEVFDGQPHNFISKPREPVEDAARAMAVITQFIREHAVAPSPYLGRPGANRSLTATERRSTVRR